MRTLLTGFGSFANIAENPSARIVEYFEKCGAPGHDLTTRVLPVSFAQAGAEIAGLLCQSRFDAAILLGVASRARKVRLERFARNQDHARIADCDGAQPVDAPIRLDAPIRYCTSMDLDNLLAGLRAGDTPVRLSASAGAYVCNHTYYAALHTIAAEKLPTRCLFVHVPPHENATPGRPAGMPLDRQIEAIRRLLELLRLT